MPPLRLFPVVVLCLLVSLASSPYVRAQTIDQAQVEAIEARIAELRALRPEVDVPVVVIQRQDLVAQLQEQASTIEAQAEIATTQKLLRFLGLIPPGLDLADLQVQLLGAQVLGLYSAEDKQITLVDGGALNAQTQTVLAHELTHALQDQHFDLAALTPMKPRNADRDLAIEALVEGDATLTSRIFALLSLSQSELRDLDTTAEVEGLAASDVPDALRDELRFVYVDGASFAQDLLAAGGWERVNEAYGRPPQSTEQVLHPAKYQDGEAPVIPGLGNAAAALGTEWQLLREDTLGELDLELTLRQFAPMVLSARAAAGWGGDRFQLLERIDDGFLAFVLRSNWDSDDDAQEFFSTYAGLVPARYRDGAVPLQQQQRSRVWATPDGVVWLEWDGSQVLVAIGPEPRHAQALAELARGG